MGTDPYAAGKFAANPYAKKSAVEGPLVVVLQGRMEDRGLALITPISRCLRRHDVHELILTDEPGARPGSRVDRIAYLGFFAVERGGVLVSGDEVLLAGRPVGVLAGFDETHMPNHLNIVVRTDRLQTGVELGAPLGAAVSFRLPGEGGE
ncbi:DUF6917 domain-containing protein [Anaeroselena agilis]|uniref:DUF6917 domain-containing protein n=1 Tax=Anaeroselena agilis TaxID=3063788 RepID=A0ABU3NYY2_9FIRM|nr:hypothetical protein [Selenomonadales bacterium 4137-cl]